MRARALQQRDDDKKANEQAKNNLESHIFETKDAMYSEAVVAVTTAEQRETILAVLTEAGNWLEDDGYIAETSVRIHTMDFAPYSLFFKAAVALPFCRSMIDVHVHVHYYCTYVPELRCMGLIVLRLIGQLVLKDDISMELCYCQYAD